MQTVTANEAKEKFAAMLDLSQREPVRIELDQRPVSVLISNDEYERTHRDKWVEFNRLSALAAAQAQTNGLTVDIVAEILAD